MENIVRVLLEKGIDEETIHEVLEVIEENYEIQEAEIPAFLIKDQERKQKEADLKKEVKEVGKQERAKAYQAKAMANLVKNVKHGKSNPGPMLAVKEALEAVLSEGRKEGETQEEFTRRLAGEMLPKIKQKMAETKAIRRHHTKEVKSANKEYKDLSKEYKEARDDSDEKFNKFMQKAKDSNAAWDVYNATYDKYNGEGDAVKRAEKERVSASRKMNRALKASDVAAAKKENLRTKTNQAYDKKWDEHDKDMAAREKVDKLSGSAHRAKNRTY